MQREMRSEEEGLGYDLERCYSLWAGVASFLFFVLEHIFQADLLCARLGIVS